MITDNIRIFLQGHNSFTTKDLTNLGATQYDIKKLIDNGEIRRVDRGVYEVVPKMDIKEKLLKSLSIGDDYNLDNIKPLLHQYLINEGKENLEGLIKQILYFKDESRQHIESIAELLSDLSDANVKEYAQKTLKQFRYYINGNRIKKIFMMKNVINELANLELITLIKNDEFYLDYVNNANSSLIDLLDMINQALYVGDKDKVRAYVNVYLSACELTDFVDYTNILIDMSTTRSNYICKFFVKCSEERLNFWANNAYSKAIKIYCQTSYLAALPWIKCAKILHGLEYGNVSSERINELDNYLKENTDIKSIYLKLSSNLTKHIKEKRYQTAADQIIRVLKQLEMTEYTELLLNVLEISILTGKSRYLMALLEKVLVNDSVEAIANSYLHSFNNAYDSNDTLIASLWADVIIILNDMGYYEEGEIDSVVAVAGPTSAMQIRKINYETNNRMNIPASIHLKKFLKAKHKTALQTLLLCYQEHPSKDIMKHLLNDIDNLNVEILILRNIESLLTLVKNGKYAAANDKLQLLNTFIDRGLIPDDKIPQIRNCEQIISESNGENKEKSANIGIANYMDAINYFNNTNDSIDSIAELYNFNSEETLLFKIYLAQIFYENSFPKSGDRLLKQVSQSSNKTAAVNKLLQETMVNKQRANKRSSGINLKRLV